MTSIGPNWRPPSTLGPLQIALLELVLFSISKAQRRTTANFILTSWARTPERNSAVGGTPNSLHRDDRGALAMDVDTDARGLFGVIDFITNDFARRSTNGDVARFFRELAPPFTQAILEEDHAHLELDLGAARSA